MIRFPRVTTLAEYVALRIAAADGNACREWRGTRNRAGYGIVGFANSPSLAHRCAWSLANGPIPPGLFVCHHCDNPPCCNIEHLFLGSAADNNADKSAKGRARSGVRPGEDHPTSILTDAIVLEVRKLVARGEPRRDIAERLGVGKAAISHIVTGRNWSHLGGPLQSRDRPFVTARQREMLRFMSALAEWSKVSALTQASQSRPRLLMQALFFHGLVDRKRVPTPTGSAERGAFMYRINEAGLAAISAAERAIDACRREADIEDAKAERERAATSDTERPEAGAGE